MREKRELRKECEQRRYLRGLREGDERKRKGLEEKEEARERLERGGESEG